MVREMDVIIFGASGYSGKRVVQRFYEISTKENRHVTWGIAGRSRTKLEEVLKEMEQKLGKTFDNVPIIEADTKNEASLMKMASSARLIINCTGPYKFHGEPVVRACIQQNCHYIDITAEPQFMERMQLKYNEEAAKNGVHVVTACGVDCIPTDMGVDFLQKNFEGTLNSIECYVQVIPDDNFGKGAAVNLGTWESFLYVMADYKELKEIRRKLFAKEMPNLEPTLPRRRCLHKVPLSHRYAGPYPSGDVTVMRRSQRYFYEQNQTRPIQIHTYLGTKKWWQYLVVFTAFILAWPFFKFQFVINFLLKHPKLATLRFFGTEPTEENTKRVKIVVTLRGEGWKGKVVDASFKEKEDSYIVAKVSGYDAYNITGTCAAVSALVLLDHGQLPTKGGVYTTAPFFTKTHLIDMLNRNGLEFEVCEQGTL